MLKHVLVRCTLGVGSLTSGRHCHWRRRVYGPSVPVFATYRDRAAGPDPPSSVQRPRQYWAKEGTR